MYSDSLVQFVSSVMQHAFKFPCALYSDPDRDCLGPDGVNGWRQKEPICHRNSDETDLNND